MVKETDAQAMELFSKCREYGIISVDDATEMLDIDLVESGVVDSMSLNMLAALLKDHYQLDIEPSQFVMELRSFNAIAEYMTGECG